MAKLQFIFMLICLSMGYLKTQKIANEMCLNYARSTKALCDSDAHSLPIAVTNAKAGEFPHMALVGYHHRNETKYLISGILISDRFVLTAGHSIRSPVGELKFIRLGALRKDETGNNNIQDFNVAETYTPKDYMAPSFYNDIGLVKLDRPVEFNSFVRPACLYTDTDIPNKKAVVTGWGPTPNEKRSADLIKETVEFVAHEECKKQFKSEEGSPKLAGGIQADTQICVSGETTGCQGESGSPVQFYNTEDKEHCMYRVVGVTTFGKICHAHSPVVNTKVSAFIPWIESVVWK